MKRFLPALTTALSLLLGFAPARPLLAQGRPILFSNSPQESLRHHLPPVPFFFLIPAGKGFTATPFPSPGVFVVLSGPPGGVLSLTIKPAGEVTTGEELSAYALQLSRAAASARPPLGGKVVETNIAGKNALMASFASGESLARHIGCVILMPLHAEAAGRDRLLIEARLSSPRGEPDCTALIEHPLLSPVLATLKIGNPKSRR